MLTIHFQVQHQICHSEFNVNNPLTEKSENEQKRQKLTSFLVLDLSGWSLILILRSLWNRKTLPQFFFTIIFNPKSSQLTSFQGTCTMWLWGLNGLRPNWSVTAPPPFTSRSNQPSSRVRVNPSRGVDVLTLTPTRPMPMEVTTRPRTTADRL